MDYQNKSYCTLLPYDYVFFCTWQGGSVNESLVCVTIQMKAIGAARILRGTLTKLYRVVVITLESLDETLVCEHLNES